MKMRILTTEEWDKLMDAVQEDNDRAHWEKMFSWVRDSKLEKLCTWSRASRGYDSARCWNCLTQSYRSIFLGFRPAFDVLKTDALTSGLQNGDSVVIGTLYMGNEPVKVPQNPVYAGDIADYIPGAKLEVREALTDPAYQVTAIRVDNALIADRCLLRIISYDDIQAACIGEAEVPTAVKIRVQEIANMTMNNSNLVVIDNGSGKTLYAGPADVIASSMYAEAVCEYITVRDNQLALWLHHDEVKRVTCKTVNI